MEPWDKVENQSERQEDPQDDWQGAPQDDQQNAAQADMAPFQLVLQDELRQVFSGLVCLWRKDAEEAMQVLHQADAYAAGRSGCEVVDVYAAFNRIGKEPLSSWERLGASAWCVFLRRELYRRGCLPAGMGLEQSSWL